MKRALTICSLVITALTVLYSPLTKAADNITHLYSSIIVSTGSGIPVEYSLMVGVGNEMIDQGVWSTPMGLPTPRLLYHFLGTPVNFRLDGGALASGLAIATIEHPLFYNLLHKGIREKSAVHLGAALHLLIDTFYHAGYSNLLGHATAGHRPDMPYDEVQKAQLCLKSIIEINYLIRDLLPKESLDFSVMNKLIADVTKDEAFAKVLMKDAGVNSILELQPIVAKRPDMMFRIMLEHKGFRDGIFTNMEKTDGYFQLAMQYLFKQFKNEGKITLNESDLGELAHVFKDIIARSDIDPMESFKIFVFRILQMQDPVLADHAKESLISLGYDYERLENILSRGRFDFSKELGVRDIKTITTKVNSGAFQNENAIPYVIHNIEQLLQRISITSTSGEVQFLKSYDWPQEVHTYANMVIPEMMSWLTILDAQGELRLTEHRDMGKIFSTNTDVSAAFRDIDRFPQYLTQNLLALRKLAGDTEKLKAIARLKAIAEVAAHIANNATKDLFPGKIGPIKKDTFEDDSLPHARLAKLSREEAAKTILAQLTNVIIKSGPKGIHTVIKEKVLAVIRKLKPSFMKPVIDEKLEKEIVDLTKEHLLNINMAERDVDGNIVTFLEKAVLKNDGTFKEVSLGFTTRGFKRWSNFTFNYAGRPMLIPITRIKNAIIKKYINNGEQMKTEVLEYLNAKFYGGPNSSFVGAFRVKYGTLPVDSNKGEVRGLILKCEALFK